MKKNLLSVLILVLLIVNIALTSVMMISVTGTNKKTAELVTNIATVMNLELSVPGQEESAVSLADTDTYDLPELMIPLAASTTNMEDASSKNKQAYIIFTLSLLQNKKHKDYSKLGGENMSVRASLIKVAVTGVVGHHTLDECQNDMDNIREEILREIQNLFDSDFVYKIGISDIKYSG